MGSIFRTTTAWARHLDIAWNADRGAASRDFEAVNPLPGLGVGEHLVARPEDQAKKVGAIVTDLVRRGFRHADIVVLSLRGLEAASLAGAAKVGSFTLARPTGGYDRFGNQIQEEGQIRFDTVHRFKGQ